ncbi:hypothetical protein [Brenneria rubrifaciens]|uniref:hypothetical protein n=1 Tax=Brenneria rubrifaciens TaxID=55213 RepID=UPI0015867F48
MAKTKPLDGVVYALTVARGLLLRKIPTIRSIFRFFLPRQLFNINGILSGR